MPKNIEMMKWRKKRGQQVWHSDAGYQIEKSQQGFGLFNVLGPPAPPKGWHQTVGGSSSLEGAKDMAARHNAGIVGHKQAG